MTKILKRQLSDSEKDQFFDNMGDVVSQKTMRFPTVKSWNLIMCVPLRLAAKAELNNIAPMCREHNRAKSQLPLYDFRLSCNSLISLAEATDSLFAIS